MEYYVSGCTYVHKEEDTELPYEPIITKRKILEFFVFLPFNGKWNFLVMIAMFSSYINSTLILTFGIVPYDQHFLLVACAISAIDVISAILHSVFKSIAHIKEYKHRKLWTFCVDAILIIPLEYIAFRLPYQLLIFNIAMIIFNIFRLIRLRRYQFKLSNSIGPVSMFFVMLKILGVTLISLHTLACVWYYIGYWEAVHYNTGWCISSRLPAQIQLILDPIDNNYLINWYIICLHFSASTITTAGFGDIAGTTQLEQWFLIPIILACYATLIGTFLADMSAALTHVFRHHSNFDNRTRVIRKILEQEQLITIVMKYYHALWTEKKGIVFPEIIKVLPSSLQQELTYSVYKEALTRCFLFYDVHENFLRTLATFMQTQNYLPGDLIIERNTHTGTLIFIAHGVVQVLTDEDDETPILYLASGSSLQVSYLILPRRSKCNITALKYTKTYELTSYNLFSILQHSKEITKVCKQNLRRVLKHSFKTIRNRKIERRQHPERFIREDPEIKSLNIMKANSKKFHESQEKLNSERWYLEATLNRDNPTQDDDKIYENSLVLRKSPANCLYVPSMEKVELAIDDACIHTKFPWVIEPKSSFFKVWKVIMLITTSVGVTLIPTQAAFYIASGLWVVILLVIVDIVMATDILFSLMTSKEMYGHATVDKFSQTAFSRLKDPFFYVDCAAAIPVYLFVPTAQNDALYRLNILLSVRKIQSFMNELRSTYLLNLTFISIIKYVSYFSIGGIWFGSVIYMISCFPAHNCKTESWFERLRSADMDKEPPQVRYLSPATISVYWGLFMFSSNAMGDIVPVTLPEFCVVILVCLIGAFFLCYLLSDYSSALTLSQAARSMYLSTTNSVIEFLKQKKAPQSLIDRAISFFEVQWAINEGYFLVNEISPLWDLSENLMRQVKVQKVFKILSKDPLLHHFGVVDINILRDLCLNVYSYVIPPNEVISLAGRKSSELIIIQNGTCEYINSLGQVTKIVSKNQTLNGLEIYLGQKNLHNIKTKTHCRIISLPIKQIDIAVRAHMKTVVQKKVEELAYKLQEEPLAHSLFHTKVKTIKVPETFPLKEPNFYKFSTIVGHKTNIEYFQPFLKLGILSGIRHLLLSKTISPGGKFLFWWEVQRTVCACLSALLFPPLSTLSIHSPHLVKFAIFLDIMAFIDIYIRLHICYYDKRNLLIKHPLKTAIHYLKTSLWTDLLACLPVHYFLPKQRMRIGQQLYVRLSYPLADIVRWNRVLQIWRFLKFLTYLENQPTKSALKIVLTKYLLVTLIFLMVLSCLIISFTCVFVESGDSYELLNPQPYYTWLLVADRSLIAFVPSDIYKIHIYAYYFACEITLGAGFGDLYCQDDKEMIICCILATLGYLLFNYMLVIISNMRASLDMRIAIYQNHMRDLIKFLDAENVSRNLTHDLVQHFEYTWHHTKGMQAQQLFSKFHRSLHEDCMLQLYQNILGEVGLFQDISNVTRRKLATLIKEAYFFGGTYIVKKNDILDHLYIVYTGEVQVIDLLGALKRPLEPGSTFGNFEQIMVRTINGLYAATNAKLLLISSQELHLVAKDDPVIMKRLELLMLHNRVYSRPAHVSKEKERLKIILVSKRAQRLMNHLAPGAKFGRHFRYFMRFLDLVSDAYYIYVVSYPMPYFVYPFIAIDLLCALEIVFNFYTPYESAGSGELIAIPKLIRKRYTSSGRFYWDIFSILPLYMLPWVIFPPGNYQHFITSAVAGIRFLRVLKLFQLLNKNLNKLNVNVLLLKSTSIAITFALLGHACTSAWHFARCTVNGVSPTGEVSCRSWFQDEERTSCNDDEYGCNLYFFVGLVTCTVFGDITPTDSIQICLIIALMILGQFWLAIFIGDFSNAIQSMAYRFDDYNFEYSLLQDYMQLNGISKKLQHEVLAYLQSLWSMQNGVQIPLFVKESPFHLKSQVFMEIYGSQLKENFIFAGCQHEFILNLLKHVEPTIYQPGNVVVREGEINSTFYMVHRGSVAVYSSDYYVETLERGFFFGMAQGLYIAIPHKYTYKITTVSVILSLQLQTWSYLLEMFPASRAEIFKRAKILNLQPMA